MIISNFCFILSLLLTYILYIIQCVESFSYFFQNIAVYGIVEVGQRNFRMKTISSQPLKLIVFT